MKSLTSLAVKHGSDKHGHHDYCRHYDKHFASLRNSPITLLELGIGGYKFPERGGSGLWMWSDYFEKGKIFGLDVYDKSQVKLPPRTRIFQGSQDDGDFLLTVMKEVGNPDIIIDDASHINTLTISSFLHLFPWLKSGGMYVIEDIESSWWNEHGFGGTPNVDDHLTVSSFNFVRDSLLLDVNAKHIPEYNAQFEIDSVCCYQNMVIITKK